MVKRKILFITTCLIAILLSGRGEAQFKIVGYVPNWINLTTFSNNFTFSRVTHINLAFKNPDASGVLPAMTSGEAFLVTKAHQNNVKVLLSIAGGNASENNAIRTIYFNLISTDANRKNFVSKLKQYIVNNNFDGLDVDLEGPAINSNYDEFIQVLADSLRPVNKLLTSALSEGYGGGAVPVSTYPNFDWINIMAYDACGSWSPSPCQHSSYTLAEDAFTYWKGRGLPASKAILGVPFYGIGFNSNPGSYSFANILASFPGRAFDDDAGNIIYYNGISTIQDKTSLAQIEGGGIMIWELSQDATGNNSLLKAIYETVITDVEKSSSLATGIAVYPNPTDGKLSLEGEELPGAEITVLNMQGQTIIVAAPGTSSLDLSAFEKGIYTLKIVKDNRFAVKKIVVQ